MGSDCSYTAQFRRNPSGYRPGHNTQVFGSRPVGAAEFRVAAALLAILAYGVAYWSIRAGKQGVGTYVMTGFVFAMLLNVILSRGRDPRLHQYAPGVVTAVLVNLPVMWYLLLRIFREHWVTWPRVLLAFAAIPAAILLLILFFSG